ncbi:salicylate hydroxylase [Cupriavidus sp. SK-4]|uniref:aromatic-ring-hydroxylating dioxygenase subunit beta n=1 Tax=Cupriavidus sp. SK-4 TaxID=574750 RepID=UPI000452B3CE|nr:aromatic-ring-hydroxylating dioxygenase subunit beta [Cupriavidus sp. SK-4]EYS98356.1 salicylate hydroxylase [Cupriavidus sp. SK-4]
MNFTDYYALLSLFADYTSAVDNGDWDRWPEFFTEDCLYRVQPRENHERGLPLATLSLESKGMLKDRIYGIRETLFHDPYYQRHIVGAPLIREADGDRIVAETNYAVLRTKPDQMTDVYNVGRYLDTIVRTPAGLRFASRICVFDSEMIPNSLIYPI